LVPHHSPLLEKNSTSSSSGGIVELFGVESPSEESHCSFPLWALRSCLPLVPYAALS
ncbi:hypothetical protein Tco_0379807, partial [Tanacetum coccineum]